ncbi:3-keto-5-aminohexanoate cleavage protein [Lichenibacterium dinghuense]|uniref:3-keto-5-aminohexanoate cleavage protein n=1 Tax=Lichenibacterium dinghuense TaxID=2895977 RepID=UPI001F2F4D99|nr:3-keto-5-aminohexanoate cleavage protein [Lichenibacterium sp. 6Y81]
MPTWIEVALNGPWTRRRQPLMPLTVDEIVAEGIACAQAGAAIVHLHAYDPATGEQDDDPDTYAAAIERIRARCDAIVYPTLPFVGGAAAFGPDAPAKRYAAVESLARRGLLEWSVVDPGSINLAGFAEAAAGGPGRTYLNPGEDVRRGLDLAALHGFTPSFAVYEPGFLRLGAAFAAATPGCPAPVYRFMFSDGFTFGPDPGAEALDLYLAMLARRAPGHPWMVAGLDFEVRPLIGEAVRRGGHVRVGLEDAPLGTAVGNLARVDEAARLVRAAGSEPATPAEVRASLRART